ncbi:MAG: hypothetical protein ACOYO0_07780, partial [Sandarakinorhabdus sp.]
MASMPLAVADALLFREVEARGREPLPAPPAWLFDEDERPDERTSSGKFKLRTVWISDVHLGLLVGEGRLAT